MWRLRRRVDDSAFLARVTAEAKLRAAERLTPLREEQAAELAELPVAELADRLRAAITLKETR